LVDNDAHIFVANMHYNADKREIFL
jgi:hypothetical protein